MYTFSEAEEYINSIVKFTTKNDQGHTKRCLVRLGSPETHFSVIHIAGTNGKGSTSAYLSEALMAAGYKTGLFTSPHLVRINERFRIDGEEVTDDAFLTAFEEVKALSDALLEEGDSHPTYFEFLFLMGMLIFRDAGISTAVLETGLGGRLDATNSVEHPVVSVITSIGMDHMQYLGDTIEEIAGEKAGIIKSGVPVIADDTAPAAFAVIRERARALQCPFYALSDAHAERVPSEEGIAFTTEIPGFRHRVFRLQTEAPYQVNNASLALLALSAVSERIPVGAECAEEGLAKMRWSGRMQRIGERTYLDGAHNAHGVAAFLSAASEIAGDKPVTLVFGAMADKDYGPMTKEIVECLHPARVITTRADEYRGADPEMLAGLFRDAGAQEVHAVEVPEEAWKTALALHEGSGEGYLFGVGSLYLIGRILKIS